MGTREDTAALLDDADEQIDWLKAIHDQALTDQTARSRFRARIKSVLEQQRSTLDYAAVDITERFGEPRGLVYYPFASNDPNFDAEIDKKMPGVRSTRPDIVAVVRQHQPYQQSQQWLGELNQLTRARKHNRLGLNIIRETQRVRVTEDTTGAYVEWEGLEFRQAEGHVELRSQPGSLLIHPEPGRDPSAPAV